MHPTLSVEVGPPLIFQVTFVISNQIICTSSRIHFFVLSRPLYSQLQHFYVQSGPPYSQSGPPYSTVWISLFTVWTSLFTVQTLFCNVYTFLCKVGTTFYLLHTILFLSQYIQNLYKAILCFNGDHYIFREAIYITQCREASS